MLCRLCHRRPPTAAALCFICNMPERDMANAWRLAGEGRLYDGYRWMLHALQLRASRDEDNRTHHPEGIAL